MTLLPLRRLACLALWLAPALAHGAGSAELRRRYPRPFEQWLRGAFVDILLAEQGNAIGGQALRFLKESPSLWLYVCDGGDAGCPSSALAFYRPEELAIYINGQVLGGKSEDDFPRSPSHVRQQLLWAMPTFLHEVSHAMDDAAGALPKPSGLDTEVLAFASSVHYLFERRRQSLAKLPRGREEWQRESDAFFAGPYRDWRRRVEARRPPGAPETASLIPEWTPSELRSEGERLQAEEPKRPDRLEEEDAAAIVEYRKGVALFRAFVRKLYPGRTLLVELSEAEARARGQEGLRAYYLRQSERIQRWVHQDMSTY
ncbi:MAG: hypothetical protein HY554_13120 [Elusimicrobia bacterium]|nr:hypothetical protein [Elusimicrobiota bacterium]